MRGVHPGSLLIASPMLEDGNFLRSVIYILEHSDTGTLGLIVNRDLDVPLGELWDDCPDRLTAARLCAEGGPVDRHKGLLLHGFTDLPETYQLAEGIAVGGDPERLEAEVADGPGHRGPRLFLGHAGWQTGQLAEEIAIGSWLVRPGHPALLLDPTPPEQLWQDLLGCGEETPDPSLN